MVMPLFTGKLIAQQEAELRYPPHDAQSLGQHYINHVMSMTSEKLHSKSDIAVQLAWRDQRIAELEQSNAQLREQNDSLDKKCAELEVKCEVALEALEWSTPKADAVITHAEAIAKLKGVRK